MATERDIRNYIEYARLEGYAEGYARSYKEVCKNGFMRLLDIGPEEAEKLLQLEQIKDIIDINIVKQLLKKKPNLDFHSIADMVNISTDKAYQIKEMLYQQQRKSNSQESI